MRPMLKPALVRVWRDDTTVQFGVDPARAVLLTGVTEAERAVLGLLDGSHDLGGLLAAATGAGLAEADTARFLERLALAGLLEDGGADTTVLRALPVGERDRLAPELAALSLSRSGPGEALSALADRHRRHVAVVGRLALVAELERLLRAAGVGRVARYPDTGALMTTTTRRNRPHLVVLAGYGVVGSETVEGVRRLGLTHLAVVVRELTGVVGPLVRPRGTSCLRCHDLHRADRDPGWPLVSVQASAAAPVCPPVPAALGSIVAGMAALQVLAELDGADPPTLDGTLELALPDWRVRRRSWHAHPDCGCAQTRAGGAA